MYLTHLRFITEMKFIYVGMIHQVINIIGGLYVFHHNSILTSTNGRFTYVELVA